MESCKETNYVETNYMVKTGVADTNFMMDLSIMVGVKGTSTTGMEGAIIGTTDMGMNMAMDITGMAMDITTDMDIIGRVATDPVNMVVSFMAIDYNKAAISIMKK
jgi:hypothetical protein